MKHYAAYLDTSYLKMVRLTVSLGSALTLTQDGARYRSAAGSYVTSAGGDLDAVDVEGAYTGSGYSTMAVAYSSGANGYGAASVTYSITGGNDDHAFVSEIETFRPVLGVNNLPRKAVGTGKVGCITVFVIVVPAAHH